MDHFSPSYFALLGPYDRVKLAETVIPENFRRVLEILSGKGIRYMLAGNMALTLHGVPRISGGLDLLVDPMEINLRRFLETLESESFNPDETVAHAQYQDEERKASSCRLRLSDNYGYQIRVLFNTPVPFGEAFERRVSFLSDSLTIDLVSIEDLVLLKAGSDDPADLADAKALEREVRGRI